MGTSVTVYAYTPEVEKLRRFYEAGLAVRPADHGNWLPFELGGGTFALHGSGERPDADPRRYQLSFTVEDIESALARFRAAGAKILRGVSDEAFGRRAILEDPEGRQVEIVQQELPQ